MSFDNYSDEDLLAEIKRRKRVKKEKPKQLEVLNCEPMRKACQQYIDEIVENKYVDEDLKQYIFECAMETIFGKDVWNWINAMLK